MFQPCLTASRRGGAPASLGEYLGILAAMRAGLVSHDPEGFYHPARLTLVREERPIDRSVRAFAMALKGLGDIAPGAVLAAPDLPKEGLARLAEGRLTPEDRAAVQAPGGFQALIGTLRQGLSEQQGRHQGGSMRTGTAGNGSFGARGCNPEGLRIGQTEGRQGRAAKVRDRREFRDLDAGRERNARTIKVRCAPAPPGARRRGRGAGPGRHDPGHRRSGLA